MKQSLVYLGIYTFLACIYTNSMLTSLNSRLKLSVKHSGRVYDLSFGGDPDINAKPNHQVVINISRTMVRDREDKFNLEFQTEETGKLRCTSLPSIDEPISITVVLLTDLGHGRPLSMAAATYIFQLDIER
ncbi:hypothetical protein BJ138DRAFT_1161446 [Hygrophoropsis aurantiaca]|uniref:Uncharacterized protein n=1 Tax=Hygrophoropsis aurantiaca TaxID=72124 RepID=A0ACB8A2J3_9AGAM|nr:hypothetical protein BJ138DRAFT_1161446 [Hygrophoropsis aurantiaca]